MVYLFGFLELLDDRYSDRCRAESNVSCHIGRTYAETGFLNKTETGFLNKTVPLEPSISG